MNDILFGFFELFKSYISVDFEGRQYKAIADYDAYLTRHFGNYLSFPLPQKPFPATVGGGNVAAVFINNILSRITLYATVKQWKETDL